MTWKTCLAVLVVVGATVFSGLLQGELTGRWRDRSEGTSASSNLATVPHAIGPWRMVSETEMTPRVKELLKPTDWLQRNYVNQDTGQRISIAITAGAHGPISVHVPEICYSSQDYKQVGERKVIRIDSDNGGLVHEFWLLSFETKDVHAAPMSVCYAWSTGGSWEASAQPRHEFAGVPTLYKIQLSAVLSSQGADSDPCQDFLSEFVGQVWPLGGQR